MIRIQVDSSISRHLVLGLEWFGLVGVQNYLIDWGLGSFRLFHPISFQVRIE